MKTATRQALLILVLCLILAQAASAEIIFGPYLQATGPETMLVCVFAEDDDRIEVLLQSPGTSDKPLIKSAAGQRPSCATFDELQADWQYSYDILVNGQSYFNDGLPSFVTDSSTVRTFVIFGDTRSGENSFDLAHRRVVQTVLTSVTPDALIHTGDFVETGDDLLLWNNFFQIEKELLAGTPIFPAAGRSDQPAELLRQIFPLVTKRSWYSFDRGPVHIIVLNLWQERSQPAAETAPDGPQISWLTQDLAQAQGQKHIFVVMHQPAIDIEGRQPKLVSRTLMPLFETYGVRAVFSGAHFFSHAVRNGIHYFTNGGGGAVLENRPAAQGVFRFFSSIHHFLVLEADRTGARVKAVDGQGESFYEADLGGGDQTDPARVDGQTTADAYVKSYPGGSRSAVLTVFFQEGCGDCEQLEELLPLVAGQTEVSLTVTFRSLAKPENRAMLDFLTDQTGPAPIAIVGSEILIGRRQIEEQLEQAVLAAADDQEIEKSLERRWLLLTVAVLAGIGLFFLIRQRRSGVSRSD